MNDRPLPPWADLIPEGMFVSDAPTYPCNTLFDRFEKDIYQNSTVGDMTYYFFDPTKHGYPAGGDYPLLIFLHGHTNALVGEVCINYCGGERFASDGYQRDFGGAYILIPLANERRDEAGDVSGGWDDNYTAPVYDLINEFTARHTGGIGNRFVLGNSSGATMSFRMGNAYPGFFKAVIPVCSAQIPDEATLAKYREHDVHIFYAIGRHDEFHDFATEVAPALERLRKYSLCYIYTPEWVLNGDGGIASVIGGIEMGQHCLMNSVQANLMLDDGTPMNPELPRGITGWIDEVNRGGQGLGRDYGSCAGMLKTGHLRIDDKISLFYEEFGSGDKYILSAQAGFYHRSAHRKMAELGYHVYCITLRGFHPSSLVYEDYGENWYDVFAGDVIAFADRMGIDRFTYMGASHGAGVGWHLMLAHQDRVNAFIAMVAGPHSLKEGVMSYRQMLEQGIIKCPPPFDPEIDSDEARTARREVRNAWLSSLPKAFEAERKLDYGRPMMRLKTEENLCNALRTITVPTLLIGGTGDPISTPELMIRTAGCLPHCKLVVYSNCGHNIDTDLIEEVADEADRFIRNVIKTGRAYLPVE